MYDWQTTRDRSNEKPPSAYDFISLAGQESDSDMSLQELPSASQPKKTESRKRSAEGSGRRPDFKRMAWDGTVPFEECMPFFMRHLIRWRMDRGNLERTTQISDKLTELAVEADRLHADFAICTEHVKIWQAYGGLGVATLDSESSETKSCGVCVSDNMYELFMQQLKECTKGATANRSREVWIEKRKAFFSMRNNSKFQRNRETGQEPAIVHAARSAMQKAFFIYNALMWESAENYRKNRNSMSKEQQDKMHTTFFDFIHDYREYYQQYNSSNKGPYMLCMVHRKVGDAIPWMRDRDYKDCLICTSDERASKSKSTKNERNEKETEKGEKEGEKERETDGEGNDMKIADDSNIDSTIDRL